MSFVRFVVWFVVGLVGTAFISSMFKNPFIVGLMVGLLVGVLGAKD